MFRWQWRHNATPAVSVPAFLTIRQHPRAHRCPWQKAEVPYECMHGLHPSLLSHGGHSGVLLDARESNHIPFELQKLEPRLEVQCLR